MTNETAHMKTSREKQRKGGLMKAEARQKDTLDHQSDQEQVANPEQLRCLH